MSTLKMEFTFTQKALAIYRRREAEMWQRVRAIAKKIAIDDFRIIINEEDMEKAWSQSVTERSPRDTV